MNEKFRDFLQDWRDNWDNAYWWADHPTLRIALLTIGAGGIGLFFHYLQVRMDAKWTA